MGANGHLEAALHDLLQGIHFVHTGCGGALPHGALTIVHGTQRWIRGHGVTEERGGRGLAVSSLTRLFFHSFATFLEAEDAGAHAQGGAEVRVAWLDGA